MSGREISGFERGLAYQVCESGIRVKGTHQSFSCAFLVMCQIIWDSEEDSWPGASSKKHVNRDKARTCVTDHPTR